MHDGGVLNGAELVHAGESRMSSTSHSFLSFFLFLFPPGVVRCDLCKSYWKKFENKM